MIRIISTQPGAYGPMDFLFDTTAEDVMVAVDIRECTESVNPQFSEVAVILTYPDDFPWLFGGVEMPDYYTYIKTFKTYQDYCSWINNNIES